MPADGADVEADPIRVFIVDDHLLLADSLAAYLRDVGIEVVGIAGTGESARELVGGDVDVVLVDYRLPDSTGDEVASWLLAQNPTVKVLLVSGTVDDEGVLRALAAGCAGFVAKGRSGAELANAIRAVHAGAAVVPPQMLGRLLSRLSLKQAPHGLGDDLTDREHDVLVELAAGLSTPAIARRLFISETTVRNHIQNILVKLQVHSKLEAVVTALRLGLVRPGDAPQPSR